MSRHAAHADPFLAIADPTRRRILGQLLASPERTLTDIATPFDVTLSAVSQHLRVLLDAGLVTVRKVGRERRYRLNADPLREVSEWVRAYDRFWEDRLSSLGEYLDNEADTESEPKP
jgi:DNA-binding transcriptional ArsR family regulator